MKQSGIIKNVLEELLDVIEQMDNEEYTSRSVNLSGATIGQHVRHVIELFQCINIGYIDGVINYDNRNRDVHIESDKIIATECIHAILNDISKEDKHIILETNFGSSDKISINSSYYRELVYNLEHAIHHMALMRVGIHELTSIPLSETFGVAPSTIEYRRKCAQ